MESPVRPRIFTLIIVIVLIAGVAPAAAQSSRGPGVIQTAIPTSLPTTAPVTGAVSITSIPSGATVVLDGAVVGTTPFTSNPVAAGSHTVTLTLAGYSDYTATVAVTAGRTINQEYTLVAVGRDIGVITTTSPGSLTHPDQTTPTLAQVPTPISITTTVSPQVSRASPTTLTQQVTTLAREPTVLPTPSATPHASTTGLQLPAYSFSHLGVTVGKEQKMPYLDVSSPYFSRQYAQKNNPGAVTTPVTFSWLEVDQENEPFSEYFGSDPSTTKYPAWSDHATTVIDQNKTEQFVNFRWTTAEKNVRGGLFQISRYPFPDDPAHWQNKYVPGLVASGQVMAVMSRYDDEYAVNFSLFDINFARAANRNPTLPPYFEGTAAIDQNQIGQGAILDTTKIPFLNYGFNLKKISIGPLTISAPVGLVAIPSGTMTQSELGNPNQDLVLSCADCKDFRTFTPLEQVLASTNQTYYIRVVPIHDNGDAGLPTLPVTVTVTRPHPCPTGVAQEISVKPPSARVLSFIPTQFNPYENHPDALQYLVSIKDPDNCTTKTLVYGTSSVWNTGDFLNTQIQAPDSNSSTYDQTSPCYGFMLRAYGHPGYHWYVPPVETHHWYDFLPGFLQDFFAEMNIVVNSVSQAWATINLAAAKLTAYILSDTLTFGAYQCGHHQDCLGVIESVQTSVEVAYGIPPTFPTFDELEDSGLDYMISIAADEAGVGDIYDSLPDSAKNSMDKGIKGVASDMVETHRSLEQDQLANAVGSWYMPDPLFTTPHPATVMVRVYNPATNTQNTSRVTIVVTDSDGLYEPSRSMVVPPLEPGQGVGIPVTLAENYEPFRNNPVCKAQPVNENGFPCDQAMWEEHMNYHVNGADTFSVSVQDPNQYSGSGTLFTLVNLDPSTDGKPLGLHLLLDNGANGACPVNSVIRFPQGWTMKLASKTVNPATWDPDVFTSPTEGLIQTDCKPGEC